MIVMVYNVQVSEWDCGCIILLNKSAQFHPVHRCANAESKECALWIGEIPREYEGTLDLVLRTQDISR